MSAKKKQSFFVCFWRRLMDILLSLVLGALLLPPSILVLVLVCIRSPGNPFYLQKRVGRGGKTIHIVKFRTMKRGVTLTDEQQVAYRLEYKLDDDPRLIGYRKKGDGKRCFGAMLRRTSLDELPQLYVNVLILGNMSLVGPRPILAEELAGNYTPEEQEILLSVKPGVTGYWQAYGRGRALYKNGERQKMELYYVTHQSFSLDVKIIFRTVFAVISKAGAK